MKKIRLVVLIIVIALFGIILARNFVVKTAVSVVVKAITGLDLNIGKISIGIFKTAVEIKDLKLYNPRTFPDKVMIDMPKIYVHYDLGALIVGKIHLKKAEIDLNELYVVKNKAGQLNLDSLKVVQENKKEQGDNKTAKAKIPDVRVDDLYLKIGKVIYKDYSRSEEPKITTYVVNINQRYKDINNAYALGSLIVVQALTNTSISRLTGFDVSPLTRGIGNITGSAVKVTGQVVGGVWDTGKKAGSSVVDAAKNILPFGKDKEQ